MDSPHGSRGSGSDSSRATSALAEHASSRGSSVGANAARTQELLGSEPQMQNLADRLAAAEKHLQERSRHQGTSVSSYDSEERDNALFAQHVEEELEKKSSVPSVDSEENTPAEGQQTYPDGSSSKQISSSGMKLRSGLPKSASASGPSKSGSSSSHSAAHLRKTQPVQHNPVEDPSSSSSGRSNNSTFQQATMDLWQQLLDSQDAKAKSDTGMLDLKSAMNSLRIEHRMEMEEMAKRVKAQEREEAKALANSEVMQQQIESLQAKHYKAKLEVNHKALQVVKNKAKEEEDKGDLTDELAGAEARHKARVEHLAAELRAAKESQKEEEAKVREKMHENKKKALEEQAALKKEVINTRTKVKNIADERDVLKRNLRSVQDTLKPQVDILREQLDVAHSEIRSTLDLPKNPEDAPEGTVVKEKSKVLSLKEQLANSKVQQKEIVDELGEMRMKMLGMQKEHNEEVGDLQMLVEKVSTTLELTTEGQEVKLPGTLAPQMIGNQMVLPLASRGLGLGRGALAGRGRGLNAKRRKGLTNKLTAIEEDEGSFDGSMACSGNVSSDGAEGVGDLGDFDEFTELPEDLPPLVVVDKKVVVQKQVLEEKVKSLQEELEQDRAMKEKLKEENIGKDAMHASKVDRLVSRLQDTKREKIMTEEALQEMKMKVSLEEEGEVERLRLKLEEEKNEKWIKAEELADMRNFLATQNESTGDVAVLKQRLFVAQEAKRISDARAQDFKGAVEQMEKQHEAIVTELRHQMHVAEGAQQAGGDTSSFVVAEVEELRQQIRGLVEERNVLTNTLEWKEVQWQNKFETMEMQQAAELADLKRCKEASMKEKSKLEAENAELRSQVEALEKEKQQLEAATKAQPQPPPPSLAPAWLQRLRCPVRDVGSGPPQSPGEAAHCQDICWRILNTMQGVTALLCSVRDFSILEASKTACMTWGSSALHGQSVLTLVNGPSRAAWLRRAFQLHQDVAEGSKSQPGFVVRDIGCEEFTNKSGHVFDSTVITAHLPAEPRCGKSAAWLVIIEPQGGSNANASAVPGPSNSSRVETRRGNQRSSQSEVSSVNPSDSASNIFDRGGLFQQRAQ